MAVGACVRLGSHRLDAVGAPSPAARKPALRISCCHVNEPREAEDAGWSGCPFHRPLPVGEVVPHGFVYPAMLRSVIDGEPGLASVYHTDPPEGVGSVRAPEGPDPLRSETEHGLLPSSDGHDCLAS